MKIGVFGNLERSEIRDAALRFVDQLNKKGFYAKRVCTEKDVKDLDVLIVLGGDGTILHIAAKAALCGVKIIGVNYGTLGFLTEFEREDADEIFEFLTTIEKSECKILRRSILEVSFNGKTSYALNEAALQRNYSDPDSQIMRTKISKGENDEVVFCGDGALLATPTGSTAYSLSAGGAIADPEARVMLLTPICSFSLNARCIALSDEKILTLEVDCSEAALLLDGQLFGKMKKGDVVTVKKAEFYAEFPVRKGSTFFQKINKKLK